MSQLKYKVILEGKTSEIYVPLNIVFININDINECGLKPYEAIEKIAKEFEGPTGINVFDMDAVTTTSDGIVVKGTVIMMAASDHGKINKEFGYLEMAELPFSEELIKEEPHLKQWEVLYSGKRLLRGPDPKTKLIPVHNVAITGRASNNNSATEMMNIITMEEILLPILGQIEIMNDGDIILGKTGECISVGIGMTIAEKFGRIFPTRQYGAGDTAHGSGEYAKTLKKHIDIIAADKAVLAKNIINALKAGMVPGKDIGCSPAVLAVAKKLNAEIAFDHITENAYEELKSVGITKEWLKVPVEKLSEEEIIAKADEIIPGVENMHKMKASELVKVSYITV